MVAIAGSGQGAVRDRSGNILDGDPAPDAQGDYHARFEAMPGDVDASGMTNVLDTIKTRNLQFTRAGDARYDPLYDVDGSGSIGVFDTIQVRNSQFTALPQGEPAVVGTPAPPVAPPIAPAPPAVRIRTENVAIASRSGDVVEGVFNVFVDVVAGANVSVAGYDVALRTASGSGITLVSAGAALLPLIPAVPQRSHHIPVGIHAWRDRLSALRRAPLDNNDGLFSVRFAVRRASGGRYR